MSAFHGNVSGAPNGLRLSCGAKFECSQTEFYQTACRRSSGLVGNGRRQLQARVRHQRRRSCHRRGSRLPWMIATTVVTSGSRT